MLERAINVTIAILLFIVLSPISLALTILLFIETKGHPIFRQKRVGKSKKGFTCYKFRTMRLNTVETGTHLINHNSITILGRYLRKTKLDEIPQLINVILGDMNFVGARPNLFSQHELIRERDKRGIYDRLPGITGISQISGIDMSNPRKLARMDLIYTKNKSFLLDCYILYSTISGHGQGDRIKKANDEEPVLNSTHLYKRSVADKPLR